MRDSRAKRHTGTFWHQQLFDAPDIKAGVTELPILVCCHCNRIVVLNPERQRARGWCEKCDAYVCDQAVCLTECNPFEQSIELALKYVDRLPPEEQKFLLRGPNGEVLIDKQLADRERIF
jgi:hypothetical protein